MSDKPGPWVAAIVCRRVDGHPVLMKKGYKCDNQLTDSQHLYARTLNRNAFEVSLAITAESCEKAVIAALPILTDWAPRLALPEWPVDHVTCSPAGQEKS